MKNAKSRNGLLIKSLEKYEKGLVSADKAAELAGISMNEMMMEISAHGIKSEETMEEYRKGVKMLLKS